MRLDIVETHDPCVQQCSPTREYVDDTIQKLNKLLIEDPSIRKEKTIAVNLAKNIEEFNTLLNKKYEKTYDMLKTFHDFFMDITEGHGQISFELQHGFTAEELYVRFQKISREINIKNIKFNKVLEGSSRVTKELSLECITEIEFNDNSEFLNEIQSIVLTFLQKKL